MDFEVPIDSLEQTPETSRKRKASVLDEEPLVRPRTLGGGSPREAVTVREIVGAGERWKGPRLLHAADLLQSPPILTFLSAKVEGSEDVLEARNSEGDGPTEVLFASSKQTQWLDYLPTPVVGLTATPSFCAAAMYDGSVNVYSHTGRRYVCIICAHLSEADHKYVRIIPTLCLGSPCAMIQSCKTALLLLTASGKLTCL